MGRKENGRSHLKNNTTPFADQRGSVTQHDKELSMGASQDLLVKGNRIVVLLVLRRHVLSATPSLFLKASFKIFDVIQITTIGARSAVGGGKFACGSRDAILPIFLDGSFVRIGNRGEKIGGGPSWLTFKAEVDEVLLGLVCRTKVQTLPFVDEQNLVDQLIQRFSGLVQRHCSRRLSHIGKRADGLDVFQCGTGIKAST